LVLAMASGRFALLDRMEQVEQVVETEFGTMPRARADVWLPAMRFIKIHGGGLHGPSLWPYTVYSGGGWVFWPHNSILLILCTVGWAGLAAYSTLGVSILTLPLRWTAGKVNPRTVVFYRLLWLSLVLVFLDSMKFDGILRMVNSYFYYQWMMVGLVFSEAVYSEGEEKVPGAACAGRIVSVTRRLSW